MSLAGPQKEKDKVITKYNLFTNKLQAESMMDGGRNMLRRCFPFLYFDLGIQHSKRSTAPQVTLYY